MTVDLFRKNKIVAIIRGATSSNILPLANALKAGGINMIEITMETPKALDALETVSAMSSSEFFVGAGTVLDPETARAAIVAGAKFIFSPTVNKETIKMTKRYGAISIPGAYTPSEIVTAYESGADLVKVFPAITLGPSFFKQLLGPLPQIPLIATGGIDENNAGDFLQAGALSIGVGSALVDTRLTLDENYLRLLTSNAERYTKLVSFY